MNCTSRSLASPLYALALASVFSLSACTTEDPVNTTGVIFYDPGNLVYHGIEDQTVQLHDGSWEGEPWVEGGASRPRVALVKDFLLLGDIDGDGSQEAVVALWHSSGGSGTFNYIAILDRMADGAVNTATATLGDRVGIEGGSVTEDGMILVDLIQHRPDEPACCPTWAVTRHYDAQLNLVKTTDRNTP